MTPEKLDKIFKVDGQARLDIKNQRGSVQIKPGVDGQVKISAIKHVNSGDDEETSIEILQSKDGIIQVYTEYERPNITWFNYRRPCKVDYIIETPTHSDVKVRSVSSRTDMNGLEGDFVIKSVSGAIKMDNLKGDYKVKSVSGLIMGEDLEGEAKFRSVSGNMKMMRCQFAHLDCKTVSGRTVIQTPIETGPYYFKSVSGNVTLVVAENTPATVFTKSISGSLKTSLRATKYSRSRRRTRATLNGGGPKVYMSSVSGSLYLVSSEKDRAITPVVNPQTKDERMQVLSKLESGDLTIEDALSKLG